MQSVDTQLPCFQKKAKYVFKDCLTPLPSCLLSFFLLSPFSLLSILHPYSSSFLSLTLSFLSTPLLPPLLLSFPFLMWSPSSYLPIPPPPFPSSTPQLHIAAANGYHQVTNLLLDAGADINITDDQGYTPFHLAIMFNQVIIK